MKFEPQALDFDVSPYTGLTRESWLEAGKYMLEGIFRHIDDFRKPVVVPRSEKEITYPHLYDSAKDQDVQRTAEVFEGLTRSFFIAAPLISDIPDLEICGYPMAAYYKEHVLRVCTPGDELYVGTYADQREITGSTDPCRSFQQTVETCALVICLWISRRRIWDTYTKEERDVIASLLESYAHASTVPHNWRLFNMLDMAFLDMEGYPVREEVMRDHAQAVLNYYAGDGWYRDGHCFDYYSCWAFNVYAPIWNLWYGYRKEPYIARRFEENSNTLMKTYGDFFDRDGWTNMWGRSNIYRNAATSAFEGNLLLPEGKADPGRARRIASGSLMQFLGREDFLDDGIPTLGFYGQFMPLVQGYSCAESPFWLGKAFLCLHLPADHPFWTAKENNGAWDVMGEREVRETCLDGPALCFSNHQANGETILRTGKVVKGQGDEHGMWNYSKLNYNTKYPWESKPSCGLPVEAQQYVLQDAPGTDSGKPDWEDWKSHAVRKANATFWCGKRDGVLYRRQFFGYTHDREGHWIQAVNLADFPVPYGIMRVDKLRLYQGRIAITLGSYGFPDNGVQVVHKEDGSAKAVILKGRDSQGAERQMAMTVYNGWEKISLLRSSQTNPDSARSIVLFASMSRGTHYGGFDPYVLISQVITRESHEDFSEDDLFPVREVVCQDPKGCGCVGPVVLKMKDGSTKTVDYEWMEGNLSL